METNEATQGAKPSGLTRCLFGVRLARLWNPSVRVNYVPTGLT